ncbi:hypothetical protein SHKM778_36430 [Streptomyces sp. KM77-8]|uniref:Uncharacterized protein n=1 Tax=Streptomyces haneummycinicus TaxID=3074435 RepID=A0AAT9HIU4_9ACTN
MDARAPARKTDPRLSAKFCELLCGRTLFGGDSEWQLMMQHINAAPTPLRELRADVPEALEELVLHPLRKAPEARPVDVQEVYERLRPFLPTPGEEPAPQAGPAGAPDPTGIFRPLRALFTRRRRGRTAERAGSGSRTRAAARPA